MKATALAVAVLVSAACICAARGQLPAPRPSDPSPWNGSWRLDARRSSPAASEPGVPQVYRFALSAAAGGESAIRWEIPELGEIVTGRTDGVPMPVRRTHPTPGLRLGVKKEGPAVLLYSVYKGEKLIGGGRMMLVDDGRAWVDLTWPDDRQDLASELVYVRQ